MSPATDQLERLRFRRQFILAPTQLEIGPLWKRFTVAGKWFLHAHPELEITQARNQRAELTLVGFLVDPERPGDGNQQICESLLAQTKVFEDLFTATHNLCGRWVLFLAEASGVSVFHDPNGLRRVYYTGSESGIWCFSDPQIAKRFLPLLPNREAKADASHSAYLKSAVEYWWPGFDSPYESVRLLPPNHALNFQTKTIRRFWPAERLSGIGLDDGARKSAELLRKIVYAGYRRFPLALPLTAGLDSRALLAATRDIGAEVYCYTLKYNSLKQKAIDLELPGKLAARLGLRHHLIECPARMSARFETIYYDNVALAHPAYGPITDGLWRHFPQERVCLKGNCNEIARCFFYNYEYPPRMDGAMLAILCGMRGNTYAIKQYDGWLREAGGVAREFGYEILDLFYWEQRMGTWQAMSQQEFDIAQEAFTPYNCRALLEMLLGVDVKYRRPRAYILYRKLVKRLWKETLAEPINPISLAEHVELKKQAAARTAKSVLAKVGLFKAAKGLYLKVKR